MYGILSPFYLSDPCNLQVGYHNEHHDFPSIPWTRLPALKALAPEYYDTIPSHPSWPMVIINFIRDAEVGIFARAKRTGTNVPVKLGASSTLVQVSCTRDQGSSDGNESDNKKFE